MKYSKKVAIGFILSLLFQSQYVLAESEGAVAIQDVKCGFGWIDCDAAVESDQKNPDIEKLKTDIAKNYGSEKLKAFEAKQLVGAPFCLTDVFSDAMANIDLNYQVKGEEITGTCSGDDKSGDKGEGKKELSAKEKAKQKANECDLHLKRVAREVIEKNRTWANQFVALDCKGPWPFNITQVGAGIEKQSLVIETMKVCGFKNITDWQYKGKPNRKVCGNYHVTKPALTPVKEVSCEKGSFNCEEGAEATPPKKKSVPEITYPTYIKDE